ncbi:peroxidase [Citrus sinensis]|uniref:Peroxidase n=1 Tax=Citrus sinensis TaxID=2711 RepID=A0ACB8JAK7_CITSI|nr:peroxidase [Citrus sinensis]
MKMGLRELTMVLILWGSCCLFAGGNGELVLHFYKKSCPSAEMLVKEEMKRKMLSDISSAATILRLAFHDCQVDGCDGSILLGNSNGITTETLSDKNFGIRKVDIINEIKGSLEKICPETVSCADIIQLAARDAVYLSGGPYIEVLNGRRDAVSAKKERADNQLPTYDISVSEFIEVFLQKNISLEDGVALMGSHTLGISHCPNFQNTLWPIKDDTLSLELAKRVIGGRGLLKIDSEIATDPRTQPYVTAFGQNTQHFFDRFSSGFLKLSNYKVLMPKSEPVENGQRCRKFFRCKPSDAQVSDLVKHIAHGRGDLLELIAPDRGDLLHLIAPGRGDLLHLIAPGRGDLLKLIPHAHLLKLTPHGQGLGKSLLWQILQDMAAGPSNDRAGVGPCLP